MFFIASSIKKSICLQMIHVFVRANRDSVVFTTAYETQPSRELHVSPPLGCAPATSTNAQSESRTCFKMHIVMFREFYCVVFLNAPKTFSYSIPPGKKPSDFLKAKLHRPPPALHI